MPTGYTAKLMDGGQTFQEFIMGCARAFGALVVMRDDPNDAPVPDKFEPSDYHAKHLIEFREKLARLKAMTADERLTFGNAEKDADVSRTEQWLAKDQAANERLTAMAEQVKAWRPPTPEHKGLKDFMLQQIGISANGIDYIRESLKSANAKPALAYYVAAVSEAQHGINYHTEENAKEVERAAGRSEWVRQLRLSI